MRERNRSGSGHAGARHEAEEEDADDHDDEEERRPASGVRRAERVDLVGRQRPIRLVGADGLVLGAVVREDAPDVAHHADGDDVADEERQSNQPLDRVGEEVGVGNALGERGQEERQEEEQPNREAEAEHHRQRDRSLAQLDILALGGDRRGAHQHARPDDQRLVQHEDAAQQRDLDQLPIG